MKRMASARARRAHSRQTAARPRAARPEKDPEAVKRVGVHWATEQCRDLLDNQVRGIHFYTLNKSDATRQIYQSLHRDHHATSSA
jgi:methylenetetrahydrofolate reductase (NADPH)